METLPAGERWVEHWMPPQEPGGKDGVDMNFLVLQVQAQAQARALAEAEVEVEVEARRVDGVVASSQAHAVIRCPCLQMALPF